jgi:hypothetical protein
MLLKSMQRKWQNEKPPDAEHACFMVEKGSLGRNHHVSFVQNSLDVLIDIMLLKTHMTSL